MDVWRGTLFISASVVFTFARCGPLLPLSTLSRSRPLICPRHLSLNLSGLTTLTTVSVSVTTWTQHVLVVALGHASSSWCQVLWMQWPSPTLLYFCLAFWFCFADIAHVFKIWILQRLKDMNEASYSVLFNIQLIKASFSKPYFVCSLWTSRTQRPMLLSVFITQKLPQCKNADTENVQEGVAEHRMHHLP